MKRSIILLIAVILFLFSGCQRKASEEPAESENENGTANQETVAQKAKTEEKSIESLEDLFNAVQTAENTSYSYRLSGEKDSYLLSFYEDENVSYYSCIGGEKANEKRSGYHDKKTKRNYYYCEKKDAWGFCGKGSDKSIKNLDYLLLALKDAKINSYDKNSAVMEDGMTLNSVKNDDGTFSITCIKGAETKFTMTSIKWNDTELAQKVKEIPDKIDPDVKMAAIIFSPSMEPALMEGETVFLYPMDPDDLKVGDIVGYNYDIMGNVIITHRVVEIHYDENGKMLEFQTKGDANSINDSDWIKAESLIGIVQP